MPNFPYTVITSTLTVTRQVFDDRGSNSSAPIVFRHSEQFQQDEEANDFMEHIELWRDEFPKPNGSFNPFRRVKMPATEAKLFEILGLNE